MNQNKISFESTDDSSSRKSWQKIRSNTLLRIASLAGLLATLSIGFQNCSPGFQPDQGSNSSLQSAPLSHDGGGDSYVEPPSESQEIQPRETCSFQGKVFGQGESFLAYEASTVFEPAICKSEVRVCSGTNMTGSYQHKSCSVINKNPAIAGPAPSYLSDVQGIGGAGSCPAEYYRIPFDTKTVLCGKDLAVGQSQVIEGVTLLPDASSCPTGYTERGSTVHIDRYNVIKLRVCVQLSTLASAKRYLKSLYSQNESREDQCLGVDSVLSTIDKPTTAKENPKLAKLFLCGRFLDREETLPKAGIVDMKCSNPPCTLSQGGASHGAAFVSAWKSSGSVISDIKALEMSQQCPDSYSETQIQVSHYGGTRKIKLCSYKVLPEGARSFLQRIYAITYYGNTTKCEAQDHELYRHAQGNQVLLVICAKY